MKQTRLIDLLKSIGRKTKRLWQSQQPILLRGTFVVFAILLIGAFFLNRKLMARYDEEQSVVIEDRNGEEIAIRANGKGSYMRALDAVPADFKKLLIKKEDRFFYFHPGVNPFSVLRSVKDYVGTGSIGGSSTITQQLVKILLGNGAQTLSGAGRTRPEPAAYQEEVGALEEAHVSTTCAVLIKECKWRELVINSYCDS